MYGLHLKWIYDRNVCSLMASLLEVSMELKRLRPNNIMNMIELLMEFVVLLCTINEWKLEDMTDEKSI